MGSTEGYGSARSGRAVWGGAGGSYPDRASRATQAPAAANGYLPDGYAREGSTWAAGRWNPRSVPSRAGGRSRPAGRGRRGRVLRTVAALAVCGTVLTAAVGVYGYERLSGNIRSMPLLAGVQGDAGTEKADPFGHTPINLLVIGSDSRANAANCSLGHDCGPGANADVELLVHVAADRSNATVMSVPRDTMTQLPTCQDPRSGHRSAAHYGQINASLAYGPGCTVAAVHALTGVPIDHFAMVDFAGVVTMSDAVGGVAVCVSNNVFDPYSHLKLAKGKHTLKGVAALEFVRSRHAFGDGSDLGRTYAQHLFLSAMIRRLKSAGVLADPAAVLALADAATKALTVDDGLGSIAKLLALAADVNKVPTNRITFATMQNRPDPANPARVVVAPQAQQLFAVIRDDRPLTTANGAKVVDAAGDAAGTRAGIAVRVVNGSGRQGRAAAVAGALIAAGYSPATTFGSAPTTARTVVRYGPGQQAGAQLLAGSLHLPAAMVGPGAPAGVTLTIGTDWLRGTVFAGPGAALPAGSAAGGAPVGAAAVGTTPGGPAAAAKPRALVDSHARTADQAAGCAPVSTQRTVAIKGVPLTPVQAYAISARLPDSAR